MAILGLDGKEIKSAPDEADVVVLDLNGHELIAILGVLNVLIDEFNDAKMEDRVEIPSPVLAVLTSVQAKLAMYINVINNQAEELH